jgi:hypothetical protein
VKLEKRPKARPEAESEAEPEEKLGSELENESTLDTFKGDDSSKALAIVKLATDESDLEEHEKSGEDECGRPASPP